MKEIVVRVKNLIVSPKTEWEKIAQEPDDIKGVAIKYLLILALIPAICTFIGYLLFGYKVPLVGYVGASFSLAIRYALISFVSSVVGVVLAAIVINMLAPSFASRQNSAKAFALVVYSYAPMFVAGILFIIPSLGSLAMLAGLYGLYLLYLGLPVMMGTNEDKHVIYFVVSLVVMVVVSVVLSLILTPIFVGGFQY